jgi:hypothetical protein
MYMQYVGKAQSWDMGCVSCAHGVPLQDVNLCVYREELLKGYILLPEGGVVRDEDRD